MIRTLIKTCYFSMLFFMLLGCIAAFLLYTTPGLYTVLHLSRFYYPGTIKFTSIKGSLLNDFTIENLEYQNKGNKIKLNQLDVRTHLSNERKWEITIHPGYYQAPDNSLIPALHFKGGTINLALASEKLTGKGTLVIDENKNLKLDFQLPHFALNTKQPIDGIATLEVTSLDFLHNLTPEINKLKGEITALLKVKGTLDKPQIEKELILAKTSLYLPKVKLNLDSVNLRIMAKENHWNATGTITSAGHHLSLQGKGTIPPDYTGEFTLTGTDFPLINTSEYQVNISPQLKLHVTPAVREISGSILIPYAQIKLQSFTNSISLPDEVVYKKQKEKPTPNLLNSNINVTIAMGKNVEINVKGLKGHLNGTLTMKQQDQAVLNAYGELSVKDGTYKAYGQDLAIQHGQLIFTGGPISSPGINLRAAKKINNTASYSGTTQPFDFNTNNLQSSNLGDNITLGVEVTGRLTNPKIQLFSDPAILSQADILSMLVLGRPASQANKAGGQLLLAAISSMNVGGTNSAQLLEQLKQSSGLDFDVQTNTNYNQLTNTVNDSTAFVVGKSLSKRLYLSYNIGLSQTDTNMLTLRYMLNKFFSIQISSSDTSNAIDFLYTANKKRNKKRARSTPSP